MRGYGKVQRERYWKGLVAEWRGSSLSVNEFCRRRGIAPSSFWYWIKRSRTKPTGHDGPVFLPVRLAPTDCGSEHSAGVLGAGSIEILIAGRYPVRVSGGFAPAALDSVITVLEAHVC